MPDIRTNQIIIVSLLAMVTVVTTLYFSRRSPKPNKHDLNRERSKDDNSKEIRRAESQREAEQLSENTDIKNFQQTSRVGDVADPPSFEKLPLNNNHNVENIPVSELQKPKKEMQSSETLIETIRMNLTSQPSQPGVIRNFNEKCEVAVPHDAVSHDAVPVFNVFDEKVEVAVPHEPVADAETRVDEDSVEKTENIHRKSSVNTHASRDSGYEEIAAVSNLNWRATEFTPPTLNWNAPEFIPTFTSPAPEPSPQSGSPPRSDLETIPTSVFSHPHGPAIKKVRCKYWPRCTNKNCKFVHPRLPCRNDRYCQFGDKCIYIHSSDNVSNGDDLDNMGRRSRGSRNSLHEQYMKDGRRSSGSSFNSHNGH